MSMVKPQAALAAMLLLYSGACLNGLTKETRKDKRKRLKTQRQARKHGRGR